MNAQDDAFVRHQQKRWMRSDAARWVRPDAARFLASGMDVTRAYPALALKYSPNQPRVPAGNPDGGAHDPPKCERFGDQIMRRSMN